MSPARLVARELLRARVLPARDVHRTGDEIDELSDVAQPRPTWLPGTTPA
ncbi:hypothetical protein ABT127_33495 [Streptomyces sp. NPDC001904]